MIMLSLIDHLKRADVGLDEEEFASGRPANLILWIILAVFAIFIIWAALTKVDRTVRGMGRVVPSSKLQVASNLEGGVVKAILVKPGQTVKKGDILVRLSPTLSAAALGSSEATVGALRAKIARLGAEVRGMSPSYSDEGSSQVAVERSLHAARSAELQGLLAAGQARAIQAERSVAEAEAGLSARLSNLQTTRRELEMLRPLAERQIVSQMDLIKAENAVEIAFNEVAAARASIARARSSVAEARAATAQGRSDWMSRAGFELSQAQAELSAQQQTLPALSDRLDRTAIRAPVSGKVNRVLVTTVGGSVSPGIPLVEIVPSDESLHIEAMIRPSDIANVHIGQSSKVEITAYNSAIFGNMQARVESVSPDAVFNEKTGESFFTVQVQTISALSDQHGMKLPVGPGMVANVSLLGDKRSILSYLFSPITKLSETVFRE
jgi:membrane fusion protein, adhesin transport system